MVDIYIEIDPKVFSGHAFIEKYNLKAADFWIMGENKLYCPSLPKLKKSDVADCVASYVNPHKGKRPDELSQEDRDKILFENFLDSEGKIK